MRYLLVLDYAYHTTKHFYADGNILLSADSGLLAAKIFTLSSYKERPNNKTGKVDVLYEVDFLQLNVFL